MAGRIVEPDFGVNLKLKSSGSGALPQLQKAKSVIDENVRELHDPILIPLIDQI